MASSSRPKRKAEAVPSPYLSYKQMVKSHLYAIARTACHVRPAVRATSRARRVQGEPIRPSEESRKARSAGAGEPSRPPPDSFGRERHRAGAVVDRHLEVLEE